MEAVPLHKGSNNSKLPHMGEGKLQCAGNLAPTTRCSQEAILNTQNVIQQ